jgi:hypothetical protein
MDRVESDARLRLLSFSRRHDHEQTDGRQEPLGVPRGHPEYLVLIRYADLRDGARAGAEAPIDVERPPAELGCVVFVLGCNQAEFRGGAILLISTFARGLNTSRVTIPAAGSACADNLPILRMMRIRRTKPTRISFVMRLSPFRKFENPC